MKQPKTESLEKHSAWRLDLAALILLVAGLLMALSLFTDEPAPGAKVAATVSFVPHRNVLGPGGTWLARVLTETLGVAVYILLISWFVLVLLLFLRRGFFTWSLRLAGWLLMLPCMAVLADYLGPQVLGGPITGSGGTLGAWLRFWLQNTLPEPVRYLVLGGSWVLALTLTCDVVLAGIIRVSWNWLRCIGAWAGTGLIRFGRWTWTRKKGFTLSPAGTENIPIHHHLKVQQLGKDSVEPKGEGEPSRIRSDSAHDNDRFADYEPPPLGLLDDTQPFPFEEHDQKLRDLAALLEKTFTDFGLNVRVVGINTGPVITQYEVALETGLRVHKVTRLADDLALNLKVPSVRIVAPIPGKNTVGIEIPNENRAVVRLKEVIQTVGKKVAQAKLPLFLGKDTEGRPLVYDLAEMPHLLIAGRTGTGKSVCLNSIILSLLMTRRPDDVKMILIDPKMTELSEYAKIAHLMHPVVKDMKKA